MTTTPLCPYCGDEFWCIERLGENYYDDYRDEKWTGFCNRCNKNFTWWERYKRISVEELEEVSNS